MSGTGKRAHELIASFVSTTQSDAGTAATFLSQTNYILEKALNLFFEHASSNSAPTKPAASGAVVDLISDDDDDDDDGENGCTTVKSAASSHRTVTPINPFQVVSSGATFAPTKGGRSHVKHVIPSDGKLLVRQALIKGLATQRGTNLLMPGEEVELRAHVQAKRSAGGSKKDTGSSCWWQVLFPFLFVAAMCL
jgi:hypothetical protein